MAARSSRYIFLPLAGALALAWLAPVVVAGQAKKSPAYKAPRRAWGDPDFQGNSTNLYEAGTPLERPAQFEGKKLSDVTREELRAFKKKIQDDTVQRFE